MLSCPRPISNGMEKVVKCKKCDLYFGHSEKNTKCPFPFCKTAYVEVEEKAVEEKAEDLPAGRQDKKGTAKTQKKSFKIWKNN